MIGLDIDGVIIDFKKGFDSIVKILYPNIIIPDSIIKYHCANEYNLSEEQFKTAINVYNYSPKSWLDLSFKPRTKRFHDSEVVLVTARSHVPHWVKDYVTTLFDLKLTIVQCDPYSKARVCEGFGLSHMIDDSLEVLRCVEVSHGVIPVKYVQSWNVFETKFLAI